MHHPNGPAVVSAYWIIASLFQQKLQPAHLFPIGNRSGTNSASLLASRKKNKAVAPTAATREHTTTTRKRPAAATPKIKTASSSVQSLQRQQAQRLSSSSSLSQRQKQQTAPVRSREVRTFEGAIFHVGELSPPAKSNKNNNNNNVNKMYASFDRMELQEQIISFGGQLLSRKLIREVRREGVHRKCFVVTNGSLNYNTEGSLTLISELRKLKLCDIVLVTPVWVKTCCSSSVVAEDDDDNNNATFAVDDDDNDDVFGETAPEEFPQLFQPQGWPIRRVVVSNRPIKLALTGFLGAERYGIQHLAKAIGASYSENMRSSHTHLICQKGTERILLHDEHNHDQNKKSNKFLKGLEWGMHVVTVGWLYHVAQYGYEGKNGGCSSVSSNAGCERDFYLVANPEQYIKRSPKRRLARNNKGADKADGVRSSRCNRSSTSRVELVHDAVVEGGQTQPLSSSALASSKSTGLAANNCNQEEAARVMTTSKDQARNNNNNSSRSRSHQMVLASTSALVTPEHDHENDAKATGKDINIASIPACSNHRPTPSPSLPNKEACNASSSSPPCILVPSQVESHSSVTVTDAAHQHVDDCSELQCDNNDMSSSLADYLQHDDDTNTNNDNDDDDDVMMIRSSVRPRRSRNRRTRSILPSIRWGVAAADQQVENYSPVDYDDAVDDSQGEREDDDDLRSNNNARRRRISSDKRRKVAANAESQVIWFAERTQNGVFDHNE